jgi:hypothetical protein
MTTTTPSGNGSRSDWPSQAAQFVEDVVKAVQAKTTTPALLVARGIVYGTLAAIVGVAALVLLAAGAVRGLDVLLPGDVWQAHLITGVVFVLAGSLLWRKR